MTTPRKEFIVRNDKMLCAVLRGHTYRQVGHVFGLSYRMVEQVVFSTLRWRYVRLSKDGSKYLPIKKFTNDENLWKYTMASLRKNYRNWIIADLQERNDYWT